MRGPGEVVGAKLPEDFAEVRSIAGDPVMDVVVTTIGDGAFLGRYKEVLGTGSLRDRVNVASYRLEGSSYGEAYESLAAGLDDAAELLEGPRWGREARDFIHEVAACMRQWTTLMVRLAG